jgi:adenine phosphoribosyltransferase
MDKPHLPLTEYVRSVRDFPKPGINFYDITTLLVNPQAFRDVCDKLETYVSSRKAEKIVAIESRGFMFGAVIADRLGLPLVPVRKPGKLPYDTVSQTYELEYGSGAVEMHTDAIKAGERVVVVDDLVATGGTLEATCRLIERLDGEVVGVACVIELSFLPWRKKLDGYDVNCLISYSS